MNQRLMVVPCGVLRLYFQLWQVRVGKFLVWYHIVRSYILWRQVPLIAIIKFGSQFVGSLPDVMHSYFHFCGVWELSVARLYWLQARPGGIRIDLGANAGAGHAGDWSIEGPCDGASTKLSAEVAKRIEGQVIER